MSPVSTPSSRWPLRRLVLTLALTGLLAACGGGGSADVPHFETTTVNGVAAVRDNTTGIVWAAQLGSTGLPGTARLATAAELLQLNDQGASVLDQYFAFAQGKLVQAQAVVGKPDVVWAVDFGFEVNGGLSDQAATDTDLSSLYVLSPQTSAAPLTYPASPASNGTVTAGGLMWKVCSEGNVWNSTARSCTQTLVLGGDPRLVAAANAQALATAANTARFAGFTGWRVPTKKELRALLQLQNDLSDRNLLPAAFLADNIGAVPQYWSSNFSSDNADAWQVDFSVSGDSGGIDLAPADDLAHVRLVRTAP